MNAFQISIVVASFIFIAGLFGLVLKLRISLNATVVLKNFFSFQCLILCVIIILALFDIYLRGYWTTKFLIWLFMLTASFLFAFGDRQILKDPLLIFTGIIFYFPVASMIISLVIPYMGLFLTFGIWLHIIGDSKAICYEDEEIRIQTRTGASMEDFKGWPEVFFKKGIIEFDKGEVYVNYYFDPDSLKVEKTKDIITVYLYKSGFDPVPFRFKR